MDPLCLSTLAGRFLDHCRTAKSLSENTLLAYDQDLKEFLGFCAGRDAREIGPDQILAYIRRLRDERGLSPATVRRRIACLKALFQWARRAGLLPASPFDDLDVVIRIPKRLPRALSQAEVKRLAAAVRPSASGAPQNPDALDAAQFVADTGNTTYLAICLMVATGLRVGELTGIRIADVDPACSAIQVRGKGSRERTVFVTNQHLQNALRAYLDSRRTLKLPDDLLFRNTLGSPLTPQALRLRLGKLGQTLSFAQRVTPHKFRHTAATLLLEQGVDIRFVQRLLGHSSISTTEIYTHVTNETLRTALQNANAIGEVIPE